MNILKNKNKSNNDIDWKLVNENTATKKLIKIFAYELDTNDLEKAYNENSFHQIVCLFSERLLFNKKNKKIFLLSIFLCFFLRIFLFGIWISFFYLLIFLLKDIFNIPFRHIGGINFGIAVVIAFLYFYVLTKFLEFSNSKQINYVKKRLITNACAINVSMWLLARLIYKSSNINNSSLKWKNFFENIEDLFKITLEIFFNMHGFYEVKKNLKSNSKIKIKKYKLSKKKPPINIIYAINFLLIIKWIIIAFYPIVCASISFTIYVLIHNL
ncbi:MAG: hypothetical protein K2H56_00295 [Malacoplasma sp.]|nr:hypothetical protein [Malacoplasma sp.]